MGRMNKSPLFFRNLARNETFDGYDIALWPITDDPHLPSEARFLILESRITVYISAANIWEIAIKHTLKRSSIPVSAAEAVQFFNRAGYLFLDITPEHARRVEALPPFHQDPFDRMLVAQSLSEPLVLITHDRKVGRYGAPTL